jgi:hypothetical protein
MNIDFFQEPDLEFGNGGRHIDVRYGLMENGPLDVGTPVAPTQMRVGIVGTRETIDGIKSWLGKTKVPIPGKESRHENLFPGFPGFSTTSCFGSEVVIGDRWEAAINKSQLDELMAGAEDESLVENTVDLFLQTAKEMLQPGGPQVLICAPPSDLLDTLDGYGGIRADAAEDDIDESREARTIPISRLAQPCFHDLLKAKGMIFGSPIQMIRPSTYLGSKRNRASKAPARKIQDEATRAWNFHTTLYYKAGGVPWRMLRQASELTTCYVGISFYKSLDGQRLHTSVAQVFNERGEGIIVKGGQASIDKNDRQAHLSKEDANALLKAAIVAYRREHKTMPARVVIHKTSKSNDAEIEGFVTAVREERIESIDLVWLRRSLCRLYRPGIYPPLRGTFLQSDTKTGILYLRGSVNFFRSYPGLYVPRPLEITAQEAETPIAQLAKEIFALSKLNWNNTQFDGGEPITLKAARKVGDILKCVQDQEPLQSNFRFYT